MMSYILQFDLKCGAFTISFCNFPSKYCQLFEQNYKQYKPTNYNADFLIFYKGRKILVEIKGFLRPDKIFLYKVYDYFIAQNYKDYEYYLIKFRGGSKKGEKIPYLQYQHVFKDPNKNNSTLYNFETIVLDKK